MIILIAIFGIVIILIGGYIAYYVYIKNNGKRRKRAHELDEDFIYNSIEKINTDVGNLKSN